jgi:hypothetical protein
MAVAVAVAMALVAAIMFAVAAVAQNTAIIDVVANRAQALRAAEFRGLARSRTWLCGVGLTAIASVVHAGALVLAPVAVVQPMVFCRCPSPSPWLLGARGCPHRPRCGRPSSPA